MKIRWQCCALGELSPAEVHAVLAARVAVFIVEQASIYQDIDAYDLDAEHLIAWSGAEVAAYLRVLAPNTKYAEPSLGRILTTTAFRGVGLGRELVTRGLFELHKRYPEQAVRIGAQAHLESFYSSFGFTTASAVYVEDGIPHIEMLRPCGAERGESSLTQL